MRGVRAITTGVLVSWALLTAAASAGRSEAGGSAGTPAPTPMGTPPSAEALLARSIDHHDPQGVWGREPLHLEVEVQYSEELAARRGQKITQRELWLDPGRARFRFIDRRDGHVLEYQVVDGAGSVSVDGRSPVPEEEKEALGVRDPTMYRDYHEYLFGLPMKLRDRGTLLDPEVHPDHFDGRPVWRIRVRYEEAVGRDLWDFFFEPESAALVGARFYHDEAAGDGEFFVMRGEIADEGTGLRLPRTRAWYTNAEGKYLATDAIVRMGVGR